MKKGQARFIFYLDKTDQLLSEARRQKDPAMWLFLNQARTPFFMLESLTRLYSKIADSKVFDKLNEHFKLVEDSLGQIDYYNSLSLSFAENPGIQDDIKKYLKKMTGQKATQTNVMLNEKGWLLPGDNRISKIVRKLKQIDWPDSAKEVEAISKLYKQSVDSICSFAAKTGYNFDNVEEDVHELRRKLRWLSIYPQALQGVVQFAPENRAVEITKKYLTEEIINSPFNRLPDPGYNTSFLLLNKNYFLSLSWIIARLGSLKDEGLLLTGLCEALIVSGGCKPEEALAKSYSMLWKNQRTMQEILDEASSVTRIYFKEENLRHLIAGVARPV